MRIMAWNTGWGGSAGTIRAQCAVSSTLAVDVAFFSEWSPSETRVSGDGTLRRSNGHLREGYLREAGFVHSCREHVLERRGDGLDWSRQYWGVLGVSRAPTKRVDARPPLFAPGSWLEVVHEASGLVLVGVRVGAWDGRQTARRREMWEWMAGQFDRLAGTPAIVMGDFNTAMSYERQADDRRYGGDLLRSVTQQRGWLDPYCVAGTERTPTYWGKSARIIDHVFVSPAFVGSIDSALAPVTVGEAVLAGPAKTPEGVSRGRLSDHAPIVVDVTPAG